jgi:hypothetical protein
MAFKGSDYFEVRNASEKYDVAKAEFQKLDRELSETSTKAKNYQDLLKRRNEAKLKADLLLDNYKALYNKRKSQYEDKQLSDKYKKQLNSNKKRLSVLEDDLQRAKDKGESTTAIQAAIDKITGNNKDLEGKLGDVGKKDNRPKGVPTDAKFNSVTGNWESGSQKWDKNGQAVVETKTSTKKKPAPTATDSTATGSMPEFPTGAPAGTAITAGFDPARVKMGEEASSGVAKPVIPTGTINPKFEEVLAKAVELYGGIDEIFNTDQELKNLLIRAIGDPATAKDDMDEDQFINLLQNTTWFKSNAGPIRQRGFEKRQYNALVKKIKTDDPQYKEKIAELNKTSAYGRGLQDVIELLRENAVSLGRQISEEDLKVIAEGIYDYANEGDAVKIRNAILGVGTFGVGRGIVSGAAGQNLTTLRAVARANGINLDTMFKDSIDSWLDKISKGESIETFKSIIRNTAKVGLPDRVASLLDQGVDLETIYSPYKKLMSAVLELNPDSIELNDPTLRMGIGPEKEVSLYEYQRMLRKDPRWQYTNNAREDVSDSALTVLRNFGFQG